MCDMAHVRYGTCVIGARELLIGARELLIGARELLIGARELLIGARELLIGARELLTSKPRTPCEYSLSAPHASPNGNCQDRSLYHG